MKITIQNRGQMLGGCGVTDIILGDKSYYYYGGWIDDWTGKRASKTLTKRLDNFVDKIKDGE